MTTKRIIALTVAITLASCGLLYAGVRVGTDAIQTWRCDRWIEIEHMDDEIYSWYCERTLEIEREFGLDWYYRSNTGPLEQLWDELVRCHSYLTAVREHEEMAARIEDKLTHVLSGN